MFDRSVGNDFSRAAGQYDAHASLQQHALSNLMRRALPLFGPDNKTLDAGCGTGRLAQQWPYLDIVQFDLAFAMCAMAAKTKAPTISGTLAMLPFADGCFDVIVSSLVLQWLPDPVAALKEMRRVLRPGGMMAWSSFGPGTLKELRESFSAIDAYPHVSPFSELSPEAESEHRVEYHPDLASLMHDLKNIGARNKLAARRKSLTTPAQMRRVEEYYRTRFGTSAGLPVTWDLLYFAKRVG